MAAPPTTPVAMVRAVVLPGRTHYEPRSVHPFKAGDEFDLPADRFAQLQELGHLALAPTPAPAAPATAPAPAAPPTAPPAT